MMPNFIIDLKFIGVDQYPTLRYLQIII